MEEEHLEEIRRLFNILRGPLPAVREVRVRSNRRRALSLTRPGGRVRLNVARAVLDAGPEAWRLIAPTLRKESTARRRFRDLVTPHMPAPRAAPPAASHRAGVGGSVPSSAGSGTALPSGAPARVRPTRPATCQGTAHERWILETLWTWARRRFEPEIPFPAPVRLRVSRRMRRSYGNASWKGDRYELALGAQLFRSGLEPILLDTFLHELAHLVDLGHRGRTDHGAPWREWAQRLGADPTRLLPAPHVERVAAAAAQGPCGLPEPVRGWWHTAHGPAWSGSL